MNCREAEQLFALLPDLPQEDPRRKMLEWHILGCETCAAEYRFWQESLEAVHGLSIDISDEQAESVNRKVMDRIYAESPWLAPDRRDPGFHKRIGRRVSIWAACFLVVFLCSALLFVMGGRMEKDAKYEPLTGVLPTAVAATDSEKTNDISISLPTEVRGVVDPFVVQMGPTYPQYWMYLSMGGMVLAIVSWKGIRRSKR
ncbi:zf-HC2 domain-containing protein [Paenibacillus aceti]|uniref:Zinc-finger domain-containing protein n=1 Tax=Paenibacillus aceti TaxID=1820010 RepID=A0ABQ1VYW5_9BACL|nr:zf-HC2 domain-containing protein [Paenibacillus aceti]GGG05227.1 hypothetical protein GCM10010913_28820 [Paenibacillus aceti]